MDNITNTLLDLKEQIENAKLEKAKLEGQLENLMQSLTDYGFTDINTTITYLETEQVKLEKEEKDIEQEFRSLQDIYI